MTPIYLESYKLIAKIDTGSEITSLNKSTFTDILKLNKIVSIKDSLSFASANNSVQRIDKTESLVMSYVNNVTFKHVFELINFNNDMKFDVLLGVDVLPKMRMGLTGVAVSWEQGEDVHRKNEEKDELFQNVNINYEDNYEPDNSPAGSLKEREGFMKIIQSSIDKNQSIQTTQPCTIPESVVCLLSREGATAYRRQYQIPYQLRLVVGKQIKEWLKNGTIKETTVNTSLKVLYYWYQRKTKREKLYLTEYVWMKYLKKINK